MSRCRFLIALVLRSFGDGFWGQHGVVLVFWIYAARTQHRSGNTLHPAPFKFFRNTFGKEPTLAGPVGFGGATDISGKSHDYLCYILTLSSARFRVLTVSGVPVRSLLRVVGGGSDA